MNEKMNYSVNPKDRVGVGQKLCYSIGYAGKDGFQTIVNNYMMMFLMMVAGLSGAFIGTMMLCARIWDAINDPMVGTLADHTNTKLGKYRPYMLASIPMAVIFFFLFLVPDIGMTQKMVYYTIFYVLYGMCFTVVEVPYYGLNGVMTNSPQERATITAWSRIASRIPAAAWPIVLAAMVLRFDGSDVTIGAKGALYTALLVGIVAIATSMFPFFGCKERISNPKKLADEEKKGMAIVRDFFSVVRGNGALLVVMIIQLFFTFNTILSDMINSYYLTYSLGSPALIMGVGVALVAIGAAIGQFFYPFIANRLQSCKLIMLIGVPLYCVLLAFCYLAGNKSTVGYLIVLIILNMVSGILQINVVNMCFEVCDKLEYKNGFRSDATVFAVVSFLMKLASGLASTIAGWGLMLVGFEGMGAVTIEVTGQMAQGVAVLRFLMPGIFAAISFFATLIYPIKKKEIKEIRAELEMRHAKEEV